MTLSSSAQLANIRRRALTADATYYRQPRGRRTRSRRSTRRPLKAFHNWLAAGQL